MADLFEKYYWYPPAETQIPWKVIFSGFYRHPQSFSTALCRYLNVNYCVLGQSARALLYKLLLILKDNDSGQRNEVLIPGYTCYSVAAAVAKAGLRISVYDLDPKTLHPDIDSIRKALTGETLAIVTQHLFGRLTPIDGLKQIAASNGSYLIEDAAQALGRVQDGTPPRALSDFGLLSFGRGKPLPIGAGGALVSDNYPKILTALRWGTAKNGYMQPIVSAAVKIMSKPYLYWLPEILPMGLGETIFDPGFAVKSMSAATERLAAGAIATLDDLNTHRRRLADTYTQLIDKTCQLNGTGPAISVIRYPIMLPFKVFANSLKRLGIRKMYPNAICMEKSVQPHLKKGIPVTPGAVEIAEKLHTLPTHMAIDGRVALQITIAVQNAVGQKQLDCSHLRRDRW